jgi:hypothetical protein
LYKLPDLCEEPEESLLLDFLSGVGWDVLSCERVAAAAAVAGAVAATAVGPEVLSSSCRLLKEAAEVLLAGDLDLSLGSSLSSFCIETFIVLALIQVVPVEQQ